MLVYSEHVKNLTDKLKLSLFNEAQVRYLQLLLERFTYDKVFYVDNELNLFRCTLLLWEKTTIHLRKPKNLDLLKL